MTQPQAEASPDGSIRSSREALDGDSAGTEEHIQNESYQVLGLPTRPSRIRVHVRKSYTFIFPYVWVLISSCMDLESSWGLLKPEDSYTVDCLFSGGRHQGMASHPAQLSHLQVSHFGSLFFSPAIAHAQEEHIQMTWLTARYIISVIKRDRMFAESYFLFYLCTAQAHP